MYDKRTIRTDGRKRKFENNNPALYKITNKPIRKKIKQAKEKWLTEECEEIERLDKKYEIKR